MRSVNIFRLRRIDIALLLLSQLSLLHLRGQDRFDWYEVTWTVRRWWMRIGPDRFVVHGGAMLKVREILRSARGVLPQGDDSPFHQECLEAIQSFDERSVALELAEQRMASTFAASREAEVTSLEHFDQLRVIAEQPLVRSLAFAFVDLMSAVAPLQKLVFQAVQHNRYDVRSPKD